MNDLITNFQDRMSRSNQNEIFDVFPSTCLSPDIEQKSAKIDALFNTELSPIHNHSVWLKHYQYRIKPADEN